MPLIVWCCPRSAPRQFQEWCARPTHVANRLLPLTSTAFPRLSRLLLTANSSHVDQLRSFPRPCSNGPGRRAWRCRLVGSCTAVWLSNFLLSVLHKTFPICIESSWVKLQSAFQSGRKQPLSLFHS